MGGPLSCGYLRTDHRYGAVLPARCFTPHPRLGCLIDQPTDRCILRWFFGRVARQTGCAVRDCGAVTTSVVQMWRITDTTDPLDVLARNARLTCVLVDSSLFAPRCWPPHGPRPRTSTTSATTCNSPSSSPVRIIGSKSALTGLSVIFVCCHESSSPPFSLS